MIHFTDITGLAGCVLAMAAIAVRLPGVARLRRPYLALLAGMVMAAVLVPFGGLPLAAYVRGVTGDLSITSLVLLVLGILGPLSGWRQPESQTKPVLLILIVFAAACLYPMALGLGLFDPYRLGYGSTWFMAGLLAVALAAYFRQLPVIALTIALAVLAWSIGWYESNNLWDYLLDPLVSVYAIGAAIKRCVQMPPKPC